jgi:acyl-[acyl-carrier-protein]-phospholipid O-acyltransferase / long-chain-fatty-acid--[acyl-carrier-protein] ligase
MDRDLKIQIRQARGKFAAMAVTYFLGVFNDNFFKISVMMLAAGSLARKGMINALFAVPFIVFAAYAGWMADRFSKRNVVIFAKGLEVVAMLCGAAGIITGSWPLMMVMVFLMATQSTIFGPSLNGTIPELYPRQYVPTANGIIKVLVTAAILLGTIASGYALDAEEIVWGDKTTMGQMLVGVAVVAVAILGVMVSFFVPRRPAADPKIKFPWAGPAETFKEFRSIIGDPLLLLIVLCDVFVWFVGAIQITVIQDVSETQFRWAKFTTSNLIFAGLVGTAIGGLLATKFANNRRWYRLLPWMMLTMSIPSALMAFTPMLPADIVLWTIALLMLLIGIVVGSIMIPCESFIQIRPKPQHKGRVIASANCGVFIGIFISAGVYYLLGTFLSPTTCFGALAVMSVIVGGCLFVVLNRKEFGNA